MFSFRKETSTNRNINSLMFITGPELSGKSWFFKLNLDKFKNSNVPKLLFHIDLSTTGSLNFESFLDIFEGEIVNKLVLSCDDTFQNENLLTAQMIIDLLTNTHDPLYLDIQLTKLIEKSLKSDDLLLINPYQRSKLLEVLAETVDKPLNSTPVIDNFIKICSILAETSSSKNIVKAALNLALAFNIQEELATCPDQKFSGLYRTGIKTTWFLLDLLNLIGGYHSMNDPDCDYPHVLIALGKYYIENAQKILEIETAEDRPLS